MPMTRISLSGIETETDSITSKTSTLQDIADPSMPNTQKDILQIIRKEEDHAMSLLAASPLLSSLFLTYASRAAALDGPPTPSPIDLEWMEMNALNTRLQEEVTSLRTQLNKETERAKIAEDCVEALRAQLSSVKDTNRDLEIAVSNERDRLESITSKYEGRGKEATKTIAELRHTMDTEAGVRAALSQVIADQQITLAQLKEKNEYASPPHAATKEQPAPTSISALLTSSPARKKQSSNTPMSAKIEAVNKTYPRKQQDDSKRSEDAEQQDASRPTAKAIKDSIKLETGWGSEKDARLQSEEKPEAGPSAEGPAQPRTMTTKGPEFGKWF